jgi:hypothetical protein
MRLVPGKLYRTTQPTVFIDADVPWMETNEYEVDVGTILMFVETRKKSIRELVFLFGEIRVVNEYMAPDDNPGDFFEEANP